MKNIELIDKAINKFNGVWPKNKFGIFCSDKYQAAILLCLAIPTDDTDAKVGEIHCGTTGCDSHYFEVICTESEFLARKAELQNKPDWKLVSEDFNFMAQDHDGFWYAASQKPWPTVLGWSPSFGRWHALHVKGEVIGDYRDTLEQRPAVTEAPEFKHGAGVLNVVDDNDWHARGELPPVGSICEYNDCENFIAVRILGHHPDKGSIWHEPVTGAYSDGRSSSVDSLMFFMPLRTEREKFIEAALSNFNGVSDKYPPASNEWLTKLFGQMYDAGFRQPDAKA